MSSQKLSELGNCQEPASPARGSSDSALEIVSEELTVILEVVGKNCQAASRIKYDQMHSDVSCCFPCFSLFFYACDGRKLNKILMTSIGKSS